MVRVEEFVLSRDLSRATVECHYRYKLGMLASYLGKRQVSLELLERYPGWLRSRGLADASIQTTIAAAKAYLRWAVEHGYAPEECMRWKPRLRIPEQAPKAIEGQDAEKMIAAARNARDRALLILLRDTGARISSLLSINIEDIDFASKRILTKQKGGRLISLYLSPRAFTAVWELAKGRSNGPLFVGRNGRLGMGGVRYILKRCAKRAGVKGRYNAHAWRHAFAKRCIIAGLDISQTSRLMGHRSIAVTARYYAVWDSAELAKAHAQVVNS